MPRWHSITVSIEPSGTLSIATREDIDPGHELECRYLVFDEEPLSVRIREIHTGHVTSDGSRAGTLADVPPGAIHEARGWISETIAGAPEGSGLRRALERHALRLDRVSAA
jgi:hypothetical protein